MSRQCQGMMSSGSQKQHLVPMKGGEGHLMELRMVQIVAQTQLPGVISPTRYDLLI